jgi:hypothetical protein
MVATLISLFAQARSRKAISSSRPKTSLPVTGNPATEIFLGPSLAGGRRVTRRTFDNQTGMRQFGHATRTNQERHFPTGLQKPATKIAANSSSSDYQYFHP